MDLRFSLEEMKILYETMMKNFETYKKSLEELNNEINRLSTFWVSDETKTYQAFKDKYNEKVKKLEEAKELMYKFCITLKEKIDNYNDSSVSAINSFM